MINKPNDSGDSGSLAGVLGNFLRSRLMNIDDMMPAIIVSYDDASNRATVKPLVQMLDTSNNKIPRANVHNIPVFRFGGGGYFMRFPIKSGDFGWIKSNDRDISLVIQRGGQEDIPNTERIKSFSDAMFFPDTLKDWLIDGNNADALVIQSLSGNSVISVHQDKIELEADNIKLICKNFDLESETASLDAKSMIINVPDLTITSNTLNVDKGGSDTKGRLTNNGKNISNTHTHSGIQTGNGTTGAVS